MSLFQQSQAKDDFPDKEINTEKDFVLQALYVSKLTTLESTDLCNKNWRYCIFKVW